MDVEQAAAALEGKLHYRFARLDLLEDALRHASVSPGTGTAPIERLEFLGDAVLGLAVSELLVRRRPHADEGELTQARSRLVNTGALARLARDLGLAELVVLGKGEEKTGGRRKPSILADVFEAILGAIFLDGGFEAARRVVDHVLDLGEAGDEEAREEDAKTSLQELTQRLFRQLPVYQTLSVEGPHHARRFVVEVSIDSRILGSGSGRSKRHAAQEAARQALVVLRQG